MRSPHSFDDALRHARTVEEVLEKVNLTAAFEEAQKSFPRLAEFTEWLIEERLQQPIGEDSSGGSGGAKPESFAKTIKKANERARQLRMKLTADDDLPDAQFERLLSELEEIIAAIKGGDRPYVFFDNVTLRGAVNSPELWDRVVDCLVEMADTVRMHADFAVKAVKIGREIARRLKKK